MGLPGKQVHALFLTVVTTAK